MFDNLKNLAGLMSHAGEIREKMAEMQERLGEKIVEADAGAGAVRVVMNGRFEVQAVRLDRAMIQTLAGSGDEADQQMIEELIAAAMNAATAKAQQMVKDEIGAITGGMNIPGLDQIMQGH